MTDDYTSPWVYRLGWGYLLAIVFALMVPVFYNFYISFNEYGFGAARYSFTLDWYYAVFQDRQLTDAFRWTFLLAITTVVFVIPMGLMAAKLFKRLTNKIWLLALMLLPLFVPADIFASAMLVYFKTLNSLFTSLSETIGWPWLSTWFELGFTTAVIGLIIYTLPYVFIVILITMGRYHPEQTEAARSCGASPWQAFWHVEFPQIKAGVFSACSFVVILTFNEYIRTSMLKGGFDTFTTVLVSQMLNTGMSEQSYAMGGIVSAVAMITIITIILITFVQQDRLERRTRAIAEPAGATP